MVNARRGLSPRRSPPHAVRLSAEQRGVRAVAVPSLGGVNRLDRSERGVQFFQDGRAQAQGAALIENSGGLFDQHREAAHVGGRDAGEWLKKLRSSGAASGVPSQLAPTT